LGKRENRTLIQWNKKMAKAIRQNPSECFLPSDKGDSVTLEFFSQRPLLSHHPQAWKNYEENYKRKRKEELRRNTNSLKKPIVILCRGYLASKGIEAIRNEAMQVYHLLKQFGTYPVQFLSMESDQTEKKKEGEVTLLSENGIGSYLKELNPALCIYFESTPNIIRFDHCSMILNRSLFWLSGQNPLQGVSQSTIEELCHFNDWGIHHYFVLSQTAYEIMVQNGFHEPQIVCPLVDPTKIVPRKRRYHPQNFTVGFASSPMEEIQKQDRGIALLCQLVACAEEISFVVLWRYDTVNIPEELLYKKNCRVITGKYEMAAFYSEIDCLLIPYQTINFNHACSLSGVEAMKNGIPVLCTEVSGISELVRYCAMGEVVAANVDEMKKGIERIRKQYELYLGVLSQKRLEEKLNHKHIVDLIEKEAEQTLPAAPVTLYEWDRKLRQNHSYLVKGHEAIKNYYQRQEIAENYTKDRFTSIALKSFDSFERKNLEAIVEDWFPTFPIQTLDLACGDGRITEECIQYGTCTAMDASERMLHIVKNRFPEEKGKLVIKQFDLVTDEIEGTYDLITCFRYLRHFEYKMRKIFYQKIYEHLQDTGIFVLDVPNLELELLLKEATGWQNYNIYDVFWTTSSIKEELEKNGFHIQYQIPVGEGVLSNLLHKAKNLPMAWTVGVSKKRRTC